jgi:hypothetical protein
MFRITWWIVMATKGKNPTGWSGSLVVEAKTG